MGHVSVSVRFTMKAFDDLLNYIKDEYDLPFGRRHSVSEVIRRTIAYAIARANAAKEADGCDLSIVPQGIPLNG